MKIAGLIVVSLAVPLFSPSAGHLFSKEGATASVSVGASSCHEVRFPHCWRDSNGQCLHVYGMTSLQIPSTNGYDFRQIGEDANQILVGFHYTLVFLDEPGNPRHSYESPDHYLVTLSKRTKIRKATQEEWKNATPLPVFAKPPNRESYAYIPNTPSFRHNGKTFAKSGPVWPRDGANAARFSRNRRYLAIQSWKGKEEVCQWLSPCSSAGGGHYWEDIYDVETGDRLVAIVGRFWHLTHEEIFETSQWVGDKYFVLPLKRNLDGFLICDVESAKNNQK